MANRLLRNLILIVILAGICRPLLAQDTIKPLPADTAKAPALQKDTARMAARQDTARLPVRPPKPYHSPSKAAFYSAILPGLGQIYNREYWKLPLVYAAVGVPAGFFIFNFDTYKEYRDAYRARVDGNPETHDQFEGLYAPEQIKTIRDTYRQYVDYSVLIFILGYGLNILDATVFAHLRGFDMSDDLSFRIVPAVMDNRALGLSLRIGIGNGKRSRHQQGWAWGK